MTQVFFKTTNNFILEIVNSGLTASEMKVLFFIKTLRPFGGRLGMTIPEIAEKLKMARTTVHRALQVLREKGFLSTKFTKELHLEPDSNSNDTVVEQDNELQDEIEIPVSQQQNEAETPTQQEIEEVTDIKDIKELIKEEQQEEKKQEEKKQEKQEEKPSTTSTRKELPKPITKEAARREAPKENATAYQNNTTGGDSPKEVVAELLRRGEYQKAAQLAGLYRVNYQAVAEEYGIEIPEEHLPGGIGSFLAGVFKNFRRGTRQEQYT